MTQAVYSTQSAIVTVKNAQGVVIGSGYIIPPWNSFFQQFTQNAPAVAAVNQNPFTPNANGTLILKGAATITLTRGDANISLTGQIIIPMGIGDSVSWTGAGVGQFLGD